MFQRVVTLIGLYLRRILVYMTFLCTHLPFQKKLLSFVCNMKEVESDTFLILFRN